MRVGRVDRRRWDGSGVPLRSSSRFSVGSKTPRPEVSRRARDGTPVVARGPRGRARRSSVGVRVVDYGRSRAGEPFVAMLRIEGEPLGVAIQRQGPLSIAHLRSLATQILLGLGAIHRARLVHADIKSNNIKNKPTEPEPRATIIDFGLACTPST